MNCRELRRLIEDYLDGTLDERERNAFEKHLGTCARCAREFRAFSLYRESVRSLPRAKAPEGFLARVKDRLREEVSPGRAPFGRRLGEALFKPAKLKLPVEAAVAAAAAVALVVALNVRQTGRRGGEEAGLRAPAEAERVLDEAAPRDAVPSAGESAPARVLPETGEVEGTAALRDTGEEDAPKAEEKRRELAFTLKVGSVAPAAEPPSDRGTASLTQAPADDRAGETETQAGKSAPDRGPRKAPSSHPKKAKKGSAGRASVSEGPESSSPEVPSRTAPGPEEQGRVGTAPTEGGERATGRLAPDAVLDRVKTLIEGQGGRIVAGGLPSVSDSGAEAEPVTIHAEVPAAGLERVLRGLETLGELEGPRSIETIPGETARGAAAPDTAPALLLTVTIVH